MIKYKNPQDSKNYYGLQITGMTFIILNSEIAIFLIRIFKKPINYNSFIWIKPIVILMIFIEIYLVINLIHMDFLFNKKILLISILSTIILVLFGYKWFPYWEDEDISQNNDEL